MVNQDLRAAKRLLKRASSVRETLKAKAADSCLADVQQILLRFVQKPYVLIMYAAVLVLFATHIDSNTHDVLDDLAEQFPNNSLINWAKNNFFRLCGALVFVPVVADAEEKHRTYIGLIVSVFLLAFPQRSIFEYFVYSISLHIYAKAKHPVTRVLVLAGALISCVAFGVFTNEQLSKLYKELPKVPTHPVNKAEKVINRMGGEVNFG
ncbi:P23 protein [Ligustrum chlorotic spot virus]|uniref:P23 protein n=1 Tax=Ligustrum chlorotic spot virus TaxID=2921791 RepID=UPI0024838E1E|nr:P23 protein [Ligustrum chlorotic spot virus]UNH55556.1 P23 protein [Ligustrum chlorotic spot virus]